MDILPLLRMLGALGVVLGLLVGALWAVRRFQIRLPGVAGAGGPSRRLELVERVSMDTRRSVALVRRGWTVRALVRDPGKGRLASVDYRQGDALDRAAVVAAAEGASIIVHAVNPPGYRGWSKLVLPMIDNSLAARDAEIDTQLRQIERPEEDQELSPKEMKAGVKAPRHAYSPKDQQLTTNKDAARLHELRKQNDRDAVKQALALLDAQQTDKAKVILTDHDVEIPGGPKKPEGPDPSDGQPVPGMEP